ncbi:Vacuolar protein-sorting-associated protein 27 [Tulasnella sp. 403]|nr:Vacuolar protein-sorting-associated protein 27 [Tulasnella sp. 403]
MSSWISWGSSAFDETVEKATSELNIAGSEDIVLNLEISDQIRSKSVTPKEAMRAISRRLNHQNPNLLDTCVKNGGDHFLVEIASREFMGNLTSILKLPALNREVREKMLKLIQIWALAFEGKASLSYVSEVYRDLQRDGFKFPPKDTVAATSVMVDTSTAPEWIDSDVCLRCRTPFTFTNRKHHCRNCGLVYDQACSSKSLPLPHFGITEPVRVCDSCHVKLQKKKTEHKTSGDPKFGRSQSLSAPRPPKPKTPREQADEDLQRAIELSLKETQSSHRTGYVPQTSSWPGASEPPEVDRGSRPTVAGEEEDDPELRAAIEASLREMNAPSAPIEAGPPDNSAETKSDPELQPLEADAIMTFNQTIQEAQARGTRDLVRYPGVGELFERANSLGPKLSSNLEETSGKEQTLTDMHDKLSEVVRLYDRLLTEQVSNPARRYAQYSSPPLSSFHQTLRSPPQQYQQSTQWSIPPQQWSAPPQEVVQPPTIAPVSQPPPQPAYAQAQPPRQYSYSQQVPPPVMAPSMTQQPSVAPPPPQPTPVAQQYQDQTPVQDFRQYDTPVQAQPPVQQEQVYHLPSSSPVTHQAVAPTPQFQPPSGVPPRPMYASPPPAPTAVRAPPPPTFQSPPVQIPNFPSAPTTAPQGYSYTPPAFEQKEKKEALLISFD